MKPEIIIHNSISLDGSLTGFMPDMDQHYSIAGSYNPDAHLIGADTIISGNEMFGEDIPDESHSDFEQPQRDETLPWWVIVDIKLAVDLLTEQFNIKRILTDTGRVLGNILINLGLVNEISLLIHPVIVGEKCYSMFTNIKATLNLEQKESENYENGCTRITYIVGNSET